jgi:hypothetical protein
MKYIRTYESFKSSKYDKLDEGILGKLFGKLKNKLSLGFSKQFGSAKKVDKIMGEYKSEIMKAEVEKNNILKAYASYLKSVKDGGDKDESKEKEISKTYDKAESNYVKQLDIIKQKFDIKFNDIMEDEENKKITNFVTLKKLEMQQELLKNELSVALTDTGLEEDDIKNDTFFKKLTGSINKKMEDNVKTQKVQTSELSEEGGSGGEEGSSFDLEAAKKSKDYEWKDSPYKDYKFEDNEELTAFTQTDFEKEGDVYKGTIAYVMVKDKQKNNKGEPVKGGEVRVTKEKDNEENKGFVIAKSKVISTKKKEEEDKGETEEKEETKKE